MKPEHPASPRDVLRYGDAASEGRGPTRVDHGAVARLQHEGRRGFVGAGGTQCHAARGHDDLQVLLLIGAHVEFGADVFGDAARGADEKRSCGVVPDHEVRLTFQLDRAVAQSVIARHAQPRVDAQQYAGAVDERELQSLAGRGGVFAKLWRLRPAPPGCPDGDECQRRGNPGPGRRDQPPGCCAESGSPQLPAGPREIPLAGSGAGQAPDDLSLLEERAPPGIGADPGLKGNRFVGRAVALDEAEDVRLSKRVAHRGF